MSIHNGTTAKRPPLTLAQILAWADLHYEYTGRYPISRSGPLIGMPEITWEAINTALRKGGRGLRGGTSLARLLEKRRDVRHTRRARPGLTVRQILQWADEHHHRTGEWPYRDSGPVPSAPDLAWATVDRYLKRGDIHLPGGSSLALLLREARGVWDGGKPMLTVKRILRWADAHFDATGRWPVTMSGPVLKVQGENWAAIDMALRHGRRGLPGGQSLSRLLREHRGERYKRHIGRSAAGRTSGRPRGSRLSRRA